MIKVAVIYDSPFGHTEKIAKHIQKGASEAGVKAEIFAVYEKKFDSKILEQYDALIFGSPTYMGSVTAKFKEFMDSSSKEWLGQKWRNKIAAGFTNSYGLSGDKLNVLIQLSIFAAQHGMIWVGQAEGNNSPKNENGHKDAINRLSSTLGLMAQSDNESPDITPPSGDLLTAEIFGKRIANIALRFFKSEA